MTNRYYWVDISKFLGLFLVVLGHLPMSGYGTNSLLIWLYSFHMPLFFIISGFLDKDKEFCIKKYFYRLLVPFLIMYIIGYFLLYLPITISHNDFSVQALFIRPLLGIVLGDTKYSALTLGPLWFILAMFIVKMIDSFQRWRWIMSISCIIVAFVVNYYNFNLYFISAAIIAYPFFFFGKILKKYIIHIENSPKWQIFCLSIFSFIIVLCVAPFNGFVSMAVSNCGKNVLLYYFVGIIGSMSIIFFSMLVNYKNKIVEVLSSGSILVIGFHVIVYAYIGFIMKKVNVFPYNLYQVLLISLVVLFSLYPVILLCQQHFPIILGKKKMS